MANIEHQLSEGTKWRLVGNAVCPSVSRAFAAQILIELGEESPAKPLLSEAVNTENVCNLNTFTEKYSTIRPRKIKVLVLGGIPLRTAI